MELRRWLLDAESTMLLDSKLLGWRTAQCARERRDRSQAKLGLLRQFMTLNGRLPMKLEDFEGERIGLWLKAQVDLQRTGKLPPEHKRALNDMCPGWSAPRQRGRGSALDSRFES